MNPPARLGDSSPAPVEKKPRPSLEEIRRAAETLEAVVADPLLSDTLADDDYRRLVIAAGRLSRPTKWELKKKSRRQRSEKRRQVNQADRDLRATTGIRAALAEAVFTAPALALPTPNTPVRELSKAQGCYVCKKTYTHA